MRDEQEIRARRLWNSINARTIGRVPRTYKHSNNLFESREAFVEWCKNQENFMTKDEKGRYWAIDKDIIMPFNKQYSPERCCFVPPEINMLFRSTEQSSLMRGVIKNTSCRSRFSAKISIRGKSHLVGIFDTEFEAHQAWQEATISKLRNVVTENKFNLGQRILDGILAYAMLIQLALNSDIPTTNITS